MEKLKLQGNSSSRNFNFEISLSVLNHLGRNLYRNFITVLGEAISNSWDANAHNVWIEIDKKNDRFFIADDGDGMTEYDFQNRFLKIGYSKRKDGNVKITGRPFIGAKGIGKLALLSCASQVSIFSKTVNTEFIGGTINNSSLDEAINEDLVPQEYPLEQLDDELLKWVNTTLGDENKLNKGAILCFEGMKKNLRNTPEHLRCLLALSFAFSTIDPQFTIHLNGQRVTVSDLKALSESSQFLWTINKYDDDFIKTLDSLALEKVELSSNLNITGYVASVTTPSKLKVRGKDDRATIDLFVNGRIRERNLLNRMPTARLTESYLYGQIHFNKMDVSGNMNDPFTSSREGVKEEDANFKFLISELRDEIVPKILKSWDEMRRKIKEDGDDEEKDVSVQQRRAESLFNHFSQQYIPDKEDDNRKQVLKWMDELRTDASFNIPAYVNCFVSENLIRKFINHKNLDTASVDTVIKQWEKQETSNLGKANISFDIRKNNDKLFYLDMEKLAEVADPKNKESKDASLWRDGISYKPVRNVIGHTGLVTEDAKVHLKMNLQNIAGRVKKLLSDK